MTTLYGIPTCDTCRKARKALAAAGHDVTFRDIRAEPLDAAERAALAGRFGDRLVNRASPSFRGLDEATKGLPPDQIIAANPTAMKRPVIHAGDAWHLGWSKEVQAALLG